MAETKSLVLNAMERQMFDAISNSDTVLLTTALSNDTNVNILDENSMTPLQHAAYKGNKEMVQLLIDQGADVNLCEHQHNYTALHFAGLSGSVDVCLALLMAGANTTITNTVNRTAAQMAAFVGHHNCVATINNYVPRREIEHYTRALNRVFLPPYLLESFHKLLMQVNIHPVRISLNVRNFIGISDHLEEVEKVLIDMRDREMKKGNENNEVLSFKFHYISYMIAEILKIRRQQQSNKTQNEREKKFDLTELFARKLLRPGKDNNYKFMDNLLRECIREFPHKECTLFRQMLSTLTSPHPQHALTVITSAINGQRGFMDTIKMCDACGEETPTKKCSKCKVVQYCDRNCQILQWHWHKKACYRLVLSENLEEKLNIDELSAEMQNLMGN